MILITGAILGGLAVVGIIFIFVYLIIKQDMKYKKELFEMWESGKYEKLEGIQ